jgi:hypothetical protein
MVGINFGWAKGWWPMVTSSGRDPWVTMKLLASESFQHEPITHAEENCVLEVQSSVVAFAGM